MVEYTMGDDKDLTFESGYFRAEDGTSTEHITPSEGVTTEQIYASAQVIAGELGANYRPRVDDLTIVRWRSGGRYYYAAMYVQATDSWYLTGDARFYGRSVFSNKGFFAEVLNRADRGTVETATNFVGVRF